jgi:hypothetical protein
VMHAHEVLPVDGMRMPAVRAIPYAIAGICELLHTPLSPGERDPTSDSGPILRHRSGPSSQFSGPIAGFLACVEDAQRLRLPSAPSPRRGPTGLHRTQFRNPNRKSRKKEKGEKIGGQMLSFARRRDWHSKIYSQLLSFG